MFNIFGSDKNEEAARPDVQDQTSAVSEQSETHTIENFNETEFLTQQQAEAQYEIDENTALDKLKKSEENTEEKEGTSKRKKFAGSIRKFWKKGAPVDDLAEKHKFLGNSFVICFIVAVLLNLFIETVSRQSTPVTGGLIYMVEQPLVFLANTLIIYATLSVSALFKRRFFVIALISSLWIALGIANGVILMQRMTPFNMKDLTALGDGITLMTTYFSLSEIVTAVAIIVTAVIVFTLLFIKGLRRTKVRHIASLAGVALSWLVMVSVILVFIKIGVLSTFFGSLPFAYRDYGVPYCFTNTWLNTGIHKPQGYSKKMIQDLFPKEVLSKDKTIKLGNKDISTNDDDKPNILFLQLESFVDPLKFKHVAFNEDPIPYYRSLMEKYTSGSLTVPACGAGTANTECEFMTGLSMHFFGPGEYPFKSVLSTEPVESIARDLKSIGYSTHAIHNHRALFYNRNEVFANMGYDTFTSVEYMSDVQRTPKGWAKDKILTSQIMDALNYTDQKDYIYTISVQGHGQYPAEKLLADPDILVTKAPSEDAKNRYEYYANEVHEMDQFIKSLTETLSKYDEKVVLVMYGDHIPALDIAEENYDAKDLYQTQYVIWDNFGMKKEDKDIAAYELPADLLDKFDIHIGATTLYHQTHDHDAPGFLSGLKALGHDMIYGKCYIYGGHNPFKASDMKLGVRDISIDEVVKVGDKYYIKGKNFTEESKITLDDTPLETVYLSSDLLGLLQKVNPEDASRMKVSQIDRNTSTIISSTE